MTGQWQTIETAKKDGTPVLLYFPNGYWRDDRNIGIGGWDEASADWYDGEADSTSMTAFGSHPTHWMDLPDPPAGPHLK